MKRPFTLERRGCTRLVFVFATFVVKIPNFTVCWRHFLTGLLANMGERDTYRWNTGDYEDGKGHLLCPVIWASWGGWLLVMQRAVVCTYTDEAGDEIDYSKWIVAGFGGDDKPDNYGVLPDGRLVKLDYGQS